MRSAGGLNNWFNLVVLGLSLIFGFNFIVTSFVFSFENIEYTISEPKNSIYSYVD